MGFGSLSDVEMGAWALLVAASSLRATPQLSRCTAALPRLLQATSRIPLRWAITALPPKGQLSVELGTYMRDHTLNRDKAVSSTVMRKVAGATGGQELD